MAQESWNLRAVGYSEPTVSAASYPYLPVPILDALAQRAGGYGLTRSRPE